MSDEFDDLPEPVAGPRRAVARHAPQGRTLSRIPELVADDYRTATAPLRAKLLECLLEPIGPLGLVAIAAGAFGEFLHRGSYRRLTVSPEDATRISADQMLELARYVEQRDPDTFERIATLLAGLSGSVLLVALQASRHLGADDQG